MKESIDMGERTNCPRCDGPPLRNWSELTDEEKEVVKRLPASADYSLDTRKKTHRWCTRCWFETVEADNPRTA